jgi:hypothetical protein
VQAGKEKGKKKENPPRVIENNIHPNKTIGFS